VNDNSQKKSLKRPISHPVLYTLAVQLLVVVPVFVVLLVMDQLWATSLLLGSIVYIVPNTYFTHYAFRFRGARSAQQIARSFYSGEFGKLALAATGFALVFRFISPLQVPAMLAGFCGLIVLQWFIAWQIALRHKI